MKLRFLNTTLSILITLSLATPATFFVAPQRAHAVIPVEVVATVEAPFSIETAFVTAISAIKNAISAVNDAISSVAESALVFNAYVLQPLAFVMSGKLLKTLTAGVIAFAIGKANGTGVPQFAADIQASLRTAGDARTLAFLNSYMRSSRSPYAGSIVAALRRDYFNETSLAGFWAANMDTLRRTSPNPYGYLNGNWALGGVAAWFALTTQDNNNPYMLYLNGRKGLASVVGTDPNPGIMGQKVADIRNNNGFTSWCGSRDGILGVQPNGAASASAAAISASNADAFNTANNNAYTFALDNHPSGMTQDQIEAYAYEQAATAGADAEAANNAAAIAALSNQTQSTNPGDPCVNSDGTQGVIKTPGSVIAASLNKVLSGEQDNIVRMGNVGPEITNIMANIATIVKTVDLATKIFQGPGGGGLFAVDTNTMARTGGNLGVGASSVYQSAASLPASGANMTNIIGQYEPHVNTIRDAANAALASAASLTSFCTVQRGTASTTLANLNNLGINLTPQQVQYKQQLVTFLADSVAPVTAAQAATSTVIAPILAQVDAAYTIIATARALVNQVQVELNNSNDATGPMYTAHIQTLQTMPPTANDLARIEQEVQAFGTAVAAPTGSLTVSGGSIVDRMALISTNAEALKGSKCTMPAFTNTGGYN